MTTHVYDSRERIGCGEFPHHKIGVLVEQCTDSRVEIESHAPVLWSGVSGTALDPGEDWRAKAAENTRHVIGRIDFVIAELQQHRGRLEAEARRLEALEP